MLVEQFSTLGNTNYVFFLENQYDASLKILMLIENLGFDYVSYN